MSNPPPPPPSVPKRILRRAANLLTSNGIPGSKGDSWLADPKRGDNKLGASIKRKFKKVKDASKSFGRSRSLSISVGPLNLEDEALQKRKGHARSQSDVHGTRPALVLSNGAPVIKRSSTQPQLPSVPERTAPAVAEPTPVIVKPHDEPSSIADVSVPQLLQQGTPMTKVSNKKSKKVVFRLDPDQGQIVWESQSQKISTFYYSSLNILALNKQIHISVVPIETIKELRSGSDARYYREQFQLSQDYEDRWLTIIYILDGNYKTLHLIAATKDVFHMWDSTLRMLHAIRQQLMSGLGNIEMRQAVWEKHYWKSADEESDQKLEFDEVEKLCKRLNINSSTENLLRLFKVSFSCIFSTRDQVAEVLFFYLFLCMTLGVDSTLTTKIGIILTSRILGGLSNC